VNVLSRRTDLWIDGEQHEYSSAEIQETAISASGGGNRLDSIAGRGGRPDCSFDD
jgi:hypothetical protein